MAEQNSHRPQNSTGGHAPRRRNPILRAIGAFFSFIGTMILIIALTGSFLAGFAAMYIKNVIIPQSDLDAADYPMNLSSTIYYTDPLTGSTAEYETLHGDENRVWVSYESIPINLVHAAVSIEDRRFYEHHGVDWIRTVKAITTMLKGEDIQGGSTITQQLIKNLTTYDDVTVKRKILEIFRALEFDKKYSKTATIEWYLNYIYFGRRCYGVSTASYEYFGKDVSQLSLAECASLISITNNPSLYDPYTHPDKNKYRQELVLDAMYKEGYISAYECDEAKAEVLDFHSAESESDDTPVYSWYTEQIITDVTNDLMTTYGYSERVAKDIVYSGGLKIYACINPFVQQAVDRVYSDASNLPYQSPSGQQLQSAIVVVDQQGNVAGLAGKMGKKTTDDTRGWNRASRTQRQPGSAIKPIAVYAPALEMGLITPYTAIEDSPPMLVGGKPWPSNVNHRYKGMMTVTDAVINSTNTVAVRVLEMVTPEVSFEYLIDKFGINPDHLVRERTINDNVYSDIGYSQLALGGLTDGVSTMDMAGAYSVFPRSGIYIRPRTYSKVLVSDSDGVEKELLSNGTTGVPVLKEGTAYYINEMLKGVVTSGSGTGAAIKDMTVAGKTGSTTANNDRWFVGYTPYYTAAVWVGYDTPERVKAPGNPAATLFGQVMGLVHEGLENQDFVKPDNLVPYAYCKDSGLKATSLCRSDMRGSRVASGFLLPEDVPSDSCTTHVAAEICTFAPVLNAEGAPTGRYYMASEFCPPVISEGMLGKVTVSALNLDRDYIGGVVPEDDGYLLSRMQAVGTCPFHTHGGFLPSTPYDPQRFDPTFPNTWPTPQDDPFFDSSNPNTWPNPNTPNMGDSSTTNPTPEQVVPPSMDAAGPTTVVPGPSQQEQPPVPDAAPEAVPETVPETVPDTPELLPEG